LLVPATMRSIQLEINSEEAAFRIYQNDHLTNVLPGSPLVPNQPSPVQYKLFDKHCDPRFQCFLFEGSEKILRPLVGQSASRLLIVSLSLAHLVADLLGEQYNMREKSVPATRHDSV